MRPDLPVEELVTFERSQAYARYADFVARVLAQPGLEVNALEEAVAS